MSLVLRVAGGVASLLALAILLPVGATAHESRDVADGQYRLVVGFRNEPVAVGDKSGLDLRVSKSADAATPPDTADENGYVPVEGLATTLQAEVHYGDQMMALTLTPRFGEPGFNASWFYPNDGGDYSFRIFGAIEGVAIDETFTSGPETFGPVEERLLFPANTAAEPNDLAGAGAGLTGPLPGGLTGGVAILGAGLVALLVVAGKSGFALPGRGSR